MAGRVFAVRYLADDRLRQGNAGAHAILIIVSNGGAGEEQHRYSPIYFTSGGATENHDASEVKTFGDFSFIWVRRHYSGTGRFVDRITLALKKEGGGFTRYELFENLDDSWKKLGLEGWEVWSRGNWFDEATLTDHLHIYRPPKKTLGEVNQVHAHIRIPYKFKNGKLVPQKAIFGDDE